MDQFIKKFHNFTIQDEKGKSYNLLVERALYQSLPKDKKKLHPLVNTITQCDDYLQFIERLNFKNVKPEEAKKEETKLAAPISDIDEKSVRTDSMDEQIGQQSLENSPQKKATGDAAPEVSPAKPK